MRTVQKLVIPAYRRETERHENGGVTHRTVEDGKLVGDVEVVIDQVMLRHMAEKALRSRSHRAILGNGLIVCKARNVRHEKEAS